MDLDKSLVFSVGVGIVLILYIITVLVNNWIVNVVYFVFVMVFGFIALQFLVVD